MKSSTFMVLSVLVGGITFVSGYCVGAMPAGQVSRAAPDAERHQPDIYPESLNRSPKATRAEFTTDEDKDAFDHAVAGGPGAYERWNGIRLHIPLVHTASRTTIQTLDKEGEPRYRALAMLLGARESNDETDWIHHEKLSVKILPREVVEVLRNKKDTKNLEEKDAVMIQFGREMFEQPKVSSKTFANMERLLGRRGTYALAETMIYFNGCGYLMRAYDQQLEDPADKHPFSDMVATQAKPQ